MADDRFERLANLVAYLAHAPAPVTFKDIVDTVPGYAHASHEAARKAFERDKKVLREESGIAITVDDEGRYRIRAEDLYLRLDLTAEERLALNVAVAAVPVSAGPEALRKLGGVESPALGAASPAFVRADLDELPVLPQLLAAAHARSTVTFVYNGDRRVLEPYGLLFRDGNWYVHGHDRYRASRRTFRVDRIAGEVEVGEAGSFERPEDVDLPSVMPKEPWLLGDDEVVMAEVRIDGAQAGKVAAELGADRVAARGEDGSIVVSLRVTNRPAFRSWVLGLLDHATVLGPAELRAEMVEWLTLIAGQERR